MICPRLLAADSTLPNEIVKQVRCGDYLLLHNGVNQFWVQVADVKERGYFDTICTSKIQTTTYKFGDLLRCHKRHVFDRISGELIGSADLRDASTHETHRA
jgi:hypothetical protein